MAIKISQPKGSKSSDILYFHAKIKSGNQKIRITNLDENQDIDDLKIAFEDLPKFPKIPENYEVAHCSVIYDRENAQVLAINPWRGVFEAIGSDIGPRPSGEDSDPIAEEKDKVGNDGKPYVERKFFEVFKITDKQENGGFFFGTTPRAYFQDKFYERADGMTDISGTSKSRWTVKLQDMVIEQGLGDEDIPWPDSGNVLPDLLERLLDNKRKVRLTFKDGWIDSILGIGDNLQVKFEESDEEDDLPDFMKDSAEEEDAKLAAEEVKTPAKKSTKAVEKKSTVKSVGKNKPVDADDDL